MKFNGEWGAEKISPLVNSPQQEPEARGPTVPLPGGCFQPCVSRGVPAF